MLEFLFLQFLVSILNYFIKRCNLSISLAYCLREILILSLDTLELFSGCFVIRLRLLYQGGDGINRFHMSFSHRKHERHDVIVNENTIFNDQSKKLLRRFWKLKVFKRSSGIYVVDFLCFRHSLIKEILVALALKSLDKLHKENHKISKLCVIVLTISWLVWFHGFHLILIILTLLIR